MAEKMCHKENPTVEMKRVDLAASQNALWEEAISKRESIDRKDLLAARVAFGVMFLLVLVAVAGIYVVGGQC